MRTNLPRVDHVLNSHLLATWHRAGRENIDRHLAVAAEERIFSLVRQFDPTGGRYHGWIALWRRRLWDVRGFRVPVTMYELDQVHAALARFDRLRDELAPDRRDIGQYRTVQDLLSVTPTHIAENKRRIEKDLLRRQAMAGSEELFRSDGWMVVRVLDYAAARFFGLGTRWCTTTSEAIFLQYASGGELLVFITPGGRYQLATRSGIFRDEQDSPFDLRVFNTAPPGFRALLKG